MAITSQDRILNEGGTERKQFVVTFDNGTLEQIEELRAFFNQEDKLNVVKLAISLLQRTKEAQERAK